MCRTFTILSFLLVSALSSTAAILDKRALLERQDFWVNRDFEWFESHIPFLETPDKEIDTTYYYRWELVTRRLVYGDPNTGYVFTEFSNRPFWSGAYGTIACPAGLQIDDLRWLRNPRYVRDYMRYWMRHPGAQPRKYSFWAAESAWSIHQVHPHQEYLLDLFPDLVENFNEWERAKWVEDMGLFWQLGHDDGMELDINSRQTQDRVRGGQSLRPSFNTYMWADAQALEKMARLEGDATQAKRFADKAARIKTNLQEKLWDSGRSFFFPMSNQRHEKDGHVVEKRTLTYQSGQFAGSPHGRELHGYVPWAFGLPDPGFEDAWQFLLDEQFFKAPYGPTTVERNDPLFTLSKRCCWWSGQSWPFATSQTLQAMAKLLQEYSQDYIERGDYAELLHTFAISHRKDGKPYIAEALHPDTGSWDYHDFPNRSEHYYHSAFPDLVVTGLAGLQPSDDDAVTFKPLIPDHWDYFALDDVPYHGYQLAILWDRNGKRYGKGAGLTLLIDGKVAAQSPKIGLLQAKLPGGSKTIPIDPYPPMNYAVNNEGSYFPRYSASHVGPGGALSMISDGEYIYDLQPVDRWTTLGSPNSEDWVAVDFGVERPLDTVMLYVIDDGPESKFRAPQSIRLEYRQGDRWVAIADTQTSPAKPEGGRPYRIRFPIIKASAIRAHLTHAEGSSSALTELQAWGPGEKPYRAAPPPKGNLSFNVTPNQGFPKATASFDGRYGGTPDKAIDGRIIYERNPNNRWTSFGSPNAESDWLAIDFGEEKAVGRVILHIYSDGGGVKAPVKLELESWTGQEWKKIEIQKSIPEQPTGGMANTYTFPAIKTSRIRAIFHHAEGNRTRSGVTEMEVWSK